MRTIPAKPTISWLIEKMTCTKSNQRHRVQQQDHNMIQLMLAMEEDS